MRRTMGLVTIVNVDQQNDIASGYIYSKDSIEFRCGRMRAFERVLSLRVKSDTLAGQGCR